MVVCVHCFRCSYVYDYMQCICQYGVQIQAAVPVIADLYSRSYGHFIFPLVVPPTVISFSWQRAPHLMCVLMIGHANRLVCCHRYIIASLSLCMENHVPQTPWQHRQA